ncbi:MAG: alkaline phytoceramidase [Bacteroidia bacterium]|nr:alkaline phytoceramidase [Bacteroidia bacterium]
MLILALVITAGLVVYGPIPQDTSYHQFADTRTYFGIPNFWDVISNAVIFLAGVYALFCWKKMTGLSNAMKWVLIAGMLLTGLGSAYYHHTPGNATLVWDRLPMTLVFMSFFSLMVFSLLSEKLGRMLFFILVPVGILSVIYWYLSEVQGHGDLRPYVLVQFFPMISLPLILYWSKPGRPVVLGVSWILICYLLAKVTEHFDKEIFSLLKLWSGHTLKHILSGVSLYYMVRLSHRL